MKNRSCRRSGSQKEQHDRAVRIRKMTDEQLCIYLDQEVDNAFRNGQLDGAMEERMSKAEKSVEHFLDHVEIPGIGVSKLNKLRDFAKEGGYIG